MQVKNSSVICLGAPGAEHKELTYHRHP